MKWQIRASTEPIKHVSEGCELLFKIAALSWLYTRSIPITKQTQKGGNYYYYCFSFWLVWPPEIEKCNQHARQIIPCLISEKTCCYPQEKSILKSVMLYSFFFNIYSPNKWVVICKIPQPSELLTAIWSIIRRKIYCKTQTNFSNNSGFSRPWCHTATRHGRTTRLPFFSWL